MSSNKPLKVAHLAPPFRLEQGGVVRAVLDLAGEMSRHGHDITLATWDTTDAPADWNNGNPDTPRILPIDPPSRLGKLSPRSIQLLTRLFKSCDAVHFHTPWEPSNIPAAKLCRQLNIPYVVSIHGMLDDWSMSQRTLKKRIFLALGARKMLENAAAVHCTAEAELTQSKPWYPKGRGVVVPLVFDVAPYRDLPGPELARQAFGIDQSKPVVLFLSRVHVKKGVHILVDAAKLLTERGIEAQYLIAGTGDEEYTNQIKQQIASNNLESRVRMLGMVKGDEKLSLYQAANVFALPTSQENFGFVLPEALACSVPAITTRGVDTWPELEASGSTLIAEQSAEAFAASIADLLPDEPRQREMGTKGRDWVLTNLDPEVVSGRYASLYQKAAQTAAR